MIASYQPAFNWASTDTFGSYNIRFSISPTDFKTDKILILSAQVLGTKYRWRPDITSWLKLMKASYNRGSVRDIYWKVIGKNSDGTKIESPVWRFQAGPTQGVTIRSPANDALLDSGIAPTFSFYANCNVKFALEFSPLADFSNPQQVVELLSSRKDPNAAPLKDQILSWDQWRVVKKRLLGEQGYFRIRAWDAINRETVSEIRFLDLYYYLVGDWDIYGTETVTVVQNGQSATEKVSFSDRFTFYLNGRQFAMIGLTQGKWNELPNDKYAISFPYDHLAAYFENQLEQELGTDVTVTVTGFYMGGKGNRVEGTIKGSIILNMSIGIPFYGMSGSASTYGIFNGSRMLAGHSLPSQETFLGKSPIVEMIGEKVEEVLSGLE